MPRDLVSWARNSLSPNEFEAFKDLHDFADVTQGVGIAPGSAATGPSFGVRVRWVGADTAPWNVGWKQESGEISRLELQVLPDSLVGQDVPDIIVEGFCQRVEAGGFPIRFYNRRALSSVTTKMREALKDATTYLIESERELR